jgi:hypothetical protein
MEEAERLDRAKA